MFAPEALDAVHLLTSLHSAALRRSALAAGRHFEGLGQVSRCKPLVLSSSVRRTLRDLDAACALVRHITRFSAEAFLSKLDAELVQQEKTVNEPQNTPIVVQHEPVDSTETVEHDPWLKTLEELKAPELRTAYIIQEAEKRTTDNTDNSATSYIPATVEEPAVDTQNGGRAVSRRVSVLEDYVSALPPVVFSEDATHQELLRLLKKQGIITSMSQAVSEKAKAVKAQMAVAHSTAKVERLSIEHEGVMRHFEHLVRKSDELEAEIAAIRPRGDAERFVGGQGSVGEALLEEAVALVPAGRALRRGHAVSFSDEVDVLEFFATNFNNEKKKKARG